MNALFRIASSVFAPAAARRQVVTAAVVFRTMLTVYVGSFQKSMKAFFSPNINRTGRIFRAAWAVGCLLGAWFAFPYSMWLGLLLVAGGGLAVFEALRGWCIMRACGIKTKF